MSHRLRLFITVAVTMASSRSLAQPLLPAASTGAVADRPLRVAVYNLPPYGQQLRDGSFVGLSVDLWRLVSDEIGVEFVLESASMRQLLEGLRDHHYDAAIGAITITRERERQIDFSYPTHASGLAIATSRKRLRASSMATALRSYFREYWRVSRWARGINAAVWTADLVSRTRDESGAFSSWHAGLGKRNLVGGGDDDHGWIRRQGTADARRPRRRGGLDAGGNHPDLVIHGHGDFDPDD